MIHPDVFDQLSNATAMATKEVRSVLASRDQNCFEIKIEIKGKSMGSEPSMLTYEISEYGYDGVKGDNLADVVDEFLRRRNWKNAHDQTLIASSYSMGE